MDLLEGARLSFMPTVPGTRLEGTIEMRSRGYGGNEVEQTYTFGADAILPNHRDTIRTAVIHPDDRLGTLFVTNEAYAANHPAKILQDDEPSGVFTDFAQRSFSTARPLQITITDDGRLHARLYYPRYLKGVTIRMPLPAAGDSIDLAYFDSIPAFGDVFVPISRLGKSAEFKTTAGHRIEVGRLTPDYLRAQTPRIVSQDEYWKRLEQIQRT